MISPDHCAVARNAPFGTHTEDVACAAVMPNGRFVSGSWDNTLKIWAPPRADATGDAMGDAQRFWRVEATLAGHTGAVAQAQVGRQGRLAGWHPLARRRGRGRGQIVGSGCRRH